MSPPPLDVVEERRTNASLVSSSASLVNSSLSSAELKEHNYMGLSDCSSVDSCSISGFSSENRCSLHLKATELRLGLPGSHSPERDEDHCVFESEKLDKKPFFPLLPPKDGILSSSHRIAASGNKRGFSDAMDRSSEVTNNVFTEGNWVYPADTSEPEAPRSVTLGKFPVNTVGTAMLASRAPQNSGVKSASMKEHSGTQLTMPKEIVPPERLQEKARDANEIGHNPLARANNNSNLPTAKAQVVGWPPIRSFRKNNTLASASKNNDEVDGKPGPGPLFVKVSMDGAPYLRKVDLRTYSKYQELSSALEKMFSCFTIGQCGPHCAQEREPLNESKLRDLLHGSEYVLTYEDKDGDWMLVGDVPWEMFVDSCRRMRIMKSCDAIGLAPRAAEKCKSRA